MGPEALREINTTMFFYRNIVENMSDGVITLNFDGSIVMFNSMAGQILGIDHDNAIGKGLVDVLFLEIEPNHDFNQVIIDAISNSLLGHNKVVHFKRKDGSDLFLSVTISYFRETVDGEKTPRGLIVLINDITEQKKLEDAERSLFKHIKQHNDFGRLYVITTLLVLFGIATPNLSKYSPEVQCLISWGELLIFFIPTFFFMKKTRMPLSAFGVTTNNLGKSLRQGIIFSGLILLIMMLYKYCTADHDEPFFNWKFYVEFSPAQFYSMVIFYMLHSYLQEFVARGVLQGSLQRFFYDAHFMLPIFLVSIYFAIFHIRVSIEYAALSFVISIVFGYIYHIHKNLIGVSIMHYSAGAMAMALGMG